MAGSVKPAFGPAFGLLQGSEIVLDCCCNTSYNASMLLLRLSLSFLLISVLLSSGMAAQTDALLIDKIAAVVDSEVITYKDVQVAAILKLSEGDEKEVLQTLIDRVLLLREAEKFKIAENGEDSRRIQKMLGDLKSSLTEERFYNVLREQNLTESEVIKMIKDKVRAEKFIDFRINFFVVISNDSINAFYVEHSEEFGEKPLSEVYEHIKTQLFSMESEKRLEEYLKGLRKRVKILVNL